VSGTAVEFRDVVRKSLAERPDIPEAPSIELLGKQLLRDDRELVGRHASRVQPGLLEYETDCPPSFQAIKGGLLLESAAERFESCRVHADCFGCLRSTLESGGDGPTWQVLGD
jgi:hypothetical protein